MRSGGSPRKRLRTHDADGKIITTLILKSVEGKTGPLYVFMTGSDGNVGHEPTDGIIAECRKRERDLVLIHNEKPDTGGWDNDINTVQYGWEKRCEKVNEVIAAYEDEDRQIILAGFSNGGGALVFGLSTKAIEITPNIIAIEIICPWMAAVPEWVGGPRVGAPQYLQGKKHFAPIDKAYQYVKDRIDPPKMLVISSPQDSGPASSGNPIPRTPVLVDFEGFTYKSNDAAADPTDEMNEKMREFDEKLHEAEIHAMEYDHEWAGPAIVWIRQLPPIGRFPFRGHSNYCGTYCGFPRAKVEDVGILPGFMGIVKKSLDPSAFVVA